MTKIAEMERKAAARQRAERSRRKAAELGRPRAEWINDALARGVAAALSSDGWATLSGTIAGTDRVAVKPVLIEALRVLIEERGCDRGQSLAAISRALGVGDHSKAKTLASGPL